MENNGKKQTEMLELVQITNSRVVLDDSLLLMREDMK